MHVVLGAGGQIADELARSLRGEHGQQVRLVSRNPVPVDEGDELFPADLTDASATARAVAGAEVAYLTVGLPPDSALWEQRFPVMMDNVIAACAASGTRLVFFDNTYMYPRTAQVQTEQTEFAPSGRKSVVRARIATALLEAIEQQRVQALICRAPEFYGPARTQSLTNTAVFDRLRQGKPALIPLSKHTRRTLIWTPDASRGMALLGNSAHLDTFGQTWHLPVDPNRQTYAQLVALAGAATGVPARAITVPGWAFRLGALANDQVGEMRELLPRYAVDNLFDSTKFARRFPEFAVTTYAEGVRQVMAAKSQPGER
ncbi:NAD-dependent epimerase/dehydratase family protein [Dermacoccaceae bacterium W4C1]